MLLALLLAIVNPPPDRPPFEVDHMRRLGAGFVDGSHKSPVFVGIGDEVFHSGWLLVDVRPAGGGNSTVIVVRESDGMLAVFYYDWIASRRGGEQPPIPSRGS
jgi:hypothetical protein